MARILDVAIAGGGIGGLTTALALAARGHRVTVLESAAQPKPLGVGINLLPHAVGVLTELGMADALAAIAIETEALVFANRFGQQIYRDPRGLAGGYAHPQYSIHRGELQMALFEAARARLGQARVRCGQRLESFEETADGRVRSRFLAPDGQPAAEIVSDVLIAADGIHSAARAQLYPAEGAPKWNGMMMWRGTTVGAPFLGGRTMIQAGNKFAKFVAYPISKALAAQGQSLINWICDIRIADGIGGTLTAPSREDWSKPGRIEDLMPTFGGWKFPFLDVAATIRAADQIFEWPMVDRDPLPRWSFGPVTLLGDAAHPMYPIGSNGATQAILDARAIAEALSTEAPVAQALAAYEAARRPMCSEIVRMNRQEGLDIILDMVDERAPNGFADLADVIDPAQIEAVVQRYKAAAGHRPLPAPSAAR